jgi:hypothetical protein
MWGTPLTIVTLAALLAALGYLAQRASRLERSLNALLREQSEERRRVEREVERVRATAARGC